MWNITKEELERLRKEYPVGCRVELTKMNDPYRTDLIPGCRGTVKFIDDTGSIHVRWDIGSSLAVIYGEDACKVVASINDTVREQILAIRATALTNMFDTIMVQRLANDMNFYELVIFIEEHRKEYVQFILTGQTE